MALQLDSFFTVDLLIWMQQVNYEWSSVSMGHVKHSERIKFTEDLRMYVYWNVGEGDNGDIDETYGLEIEVEANERSTDYWNVLSRCSFGYELWSEDIWEKWGNHVTWSLDDFEKSEQGYQQATEWIQAFDCRYSRGEGHLRELHVLKEILGI